MDLTVDNFYLQELHTPMGRETISVQRNRRTLIMAMGIDSDMDVVP